MRHKKPDRDGQVWIELGYVPGDEEFNQRQCDAGNLVLRRLFGEGTPLKFWRGSKTPYNLTTDEAGGYVGLNDDGHWFFLVEPEKK